MAVPLFSDLQNPGLEMLRLARERLGAGYTNNTYSVSSPISLKDLSNLSGGNSGGSGNSYPAINMLNVQSPAFSRNRRPDGNNPLKMSEFFGYNQNLQRRVVRFAYSSSNASTACSFSIQSTEYWHDGSNTLPVSGDKIYTTETGFTAAPSGYYQLFNPSSGVSEGTVAEVIGGGGGFAGTVAGVDSC
jgi:hypothetical protein|tara:strand:+ start:653 stop:1216 length:564 start_codon:yes stop_codon:yes gene_type:complete